MKWWWQSTIAAGSGGMGALLAAADGRSLASVDSTGSGGLSLETRQGWVKGGESGPAIVPGKPAESLLLSAIRYEDNDLRMPPDKKLSKEVVADFEKWIAMGAHDPRDAPMEAVTESSGPKAKSLEEGRTSL